MKPNTVGRVSGSTGPTHPVLQTGPLSYPDADAMLDCGLPFGTVLLTADGELPVQFLTDGDRVITRDSGYAGLTGLRLLRRKTRAIFFTAGSLGDTRPDCDLILPAGQKVLIRDWRARALFGRAEALVRADALPDGEFIRDLGEREMNLCLPEFDTPHVIYAGGLELGCPGTAQHLRPAA